MGKPSAGPGRRRRPLSGATGVAQVVQASRPFEAIVRNQEWMGRGVEIWPEHPHYPASYGAADARITGGNGQDWKGVPRKGGDTVSHLPLSALISEALVAFAMDYEERSPVALSLSTGVIMRIPSKGRPLKVLGYSVGVAALDRHGFVRVSGGNGNEVVRLTPKGLAVRDAHEGRIRAVEAEWRDVFGDKRVAALLRALEEVAKVAR